MDKIIILGGPYIEEPCEYCGKMDELRPYGKDGAKICFDCAMLPENIELTEVTFAGIIRGEVETNEDQKN